MLYICDHISDNERHVFDCLSGGFMENGLPLTETASIQGNTMKLKLCDSLDKRYQTACYLEQSALFELLSDRSRDYTKNIGYCRQVSDPENRMACVKLFAIRAVRIAHYPDIARMCSNTSTTYEQLACTAVVANKIASSLGSDQTKEQYLGVVQTVCSTLTGVMRKECIYRAAYQPLDLFYVGDRDFEPIL
jgi:hypothetical protein